MFKFPGRVLYLYQLRHYLLGFPITGTANHIHNSTICISLKV